MLAKGGRDSGYIGRDLFKVFKPVGTEFDFKICWKLSDRVNIYH